MASVNAPQLRNIKSHIADQTLIVPEEIVEEILSRLPVKSLLRFRCVSKSWRSLIGSKRFVKTHLENSTKDTSFAHHRIIILSDLPKCRPKHCSLHSLLNEPFTDSFTFDFSIKTRWDSIYLVGCCNGLVCVLLDEKYFVLWNPSTRMSKKLPDIDREGKHLHAWVCGFGCDESSGDYKVFGMICGRDGDVYKLYSLKTDSWRVTESSGNGGRFFGYGKFASGKLHWRRKFGSARDWDIVSLDLKSEVYGVVEQPSYSEGHFRGSFGVLGGCLCVPCYYENDCVDVWVMKQYGVKESWNKVVTVPHLHVSAPRGLFTLFCMGPNGELALLSFSKFIVYYPKDNGVRTINSDSFTDAGIYVESLVSLAPDGEQELQEQMHE